MAPRDSRSGLTVERPAQGRKETAAAAAGKQKPSPPGKSENEGIRQIPARTRATGWPHPSLDGEVWPRKAGPGRAQPNRYPDFGSNLAPAFPARSREPVAVGVCNPLQWRNRPRFSRGFLTPGCDVEMDILSISFKERVLLTPGTSRCQEENKKIRPMFPSAGF
jgi:hypothetical protein